MIDAGQISTNSTEVPSTATFKIDISNACSATQKLFNIVAFGKVTCQHIHIAHPETFAYADIFNRFARALGAIPIGVTSQGS